MTEAQQLSEKIKEENWTRLALTSFTSNTFANLNSIIRSAKKNGNLEKIRQLCTNHLTHTPNSVMASYVMGKLSYEDGNWSSGYLEQLIDIFMKNRNFGVAEFLAKEILKYAENITALNAIAECMTNTGRENDIVKVWERLVKIDSEEANLAKKVAELKEEGGNKEEAVLYYKRALFRYLKKKKHNQVEGIWLKLLEYIPDDLTFFLHAEKRIADSIGEAKSKLLLSFLVPHFKDKGEYDTAIDLLKKILSYDHEDKNARSELVDCYKEKYTDHSHLEEYLGMSGLEDYSKDVYDAIDDFENHIIFDTGTYVFHRRWGIGICRELKNHSLIIDFDKKLKHRMTLQMAVTSLQRLPDDHIWLLKRRNQNKLRELILNDVEEGLKIVIKSKNNEATAKDIKELLDGILTRKEWTKWWNRAKVVLKKNPFFGMSPEKNDAYYIRKQPLTLDEDLYTKFKSEREFIIRFKLFYDFIKNCDIESEYFDDMQGFFTNFISSVEVIDINSVLSFLLLKKLESLYPYLQIEFLFDFGDIMERVKDIHTLFPSIPHNELKESFLIYVKKTTENWPEIFIKCFYEYPVKFIIDQLDSSGYKNLVKETLKKIISRYRINRDLFMWISKNFVVKNTVYIEKKDFDRVIMGLLHLLEIAQRELINEKNVVANRKLFNTVTNLLFEEQLLISYIKRSEETAVRKLLPTIKNIGELKDEYLIKLRLAVKTAHPEFKFKDEVEKIDKREKLIVTERAYELKQHELRYLIENAIPSNQRKINSIKNKKENKEYTYACKKQKILKKEAEALKANLSKAQVLNPRKIKTNTVSVGTTVTLDNIYDHKTKKFTILGPWELDPSKKIISYTSPAGKSLLNHSPGDIVTMESKKNGKKYKIRKIEQAVF